MQLWRLFSDFADSFNIKTFEKWVTVAEASIIRQKTDTDETINCMNRFIKNLESTMNGISHFPLKTFKSGSYYDRTKVPNRFLQQTSFLPKF